MANIELTSGRDSARQRGKVHFGVGFPVEWHACHKFLKRSNEEPGIKDDVWSAVVWRKQAQNGELEFWQG